ncbi:MAG: 2-phospho-L-lactate guanylyltransferase [Rudaea sp.]
MDDPILAVVPCKPFAEAKQRLAQVLDAGERADLSRRLLEHALAVLSRARGISRVAVVSRDDEVLRVARGRGAWAIWEAQAGLNVALEQATRVAVANGFRGVLILPADLPNVETREVEEIVALAQTPPCVVIAPAQRDEGTNALLVRPAGFIDYAFGEKSSVEHRRRAEAAGARVEVYRSPGLAFDLDLPEDWHSMQAAARSLEGD